ncbi:hypothetical protein PM082_014288 [Marasmius tenuissimus]|nr:hypothetical protein PM082_014288 [Marasmius tenuissimus]
MSPQRPSIHVQWLSCISLFFQPAFSSPVFVNYVDKTELVSPKNRPSLSSSLTRRKDHDPENNTHPVVIILPSVFIFLMVVTLGVMYYRRCRRERAGS